MVSIVQIIKSESMLGSRNYTNLKNHHHPMFLYSEREIISPKTILEVPCNVSDGDLGYIYGTPNKPHDPIHLGFAVTQTSSASLNDMMVAEQLHHTYDGSCNLDAIFKDAFPDLSGEILLHESLDGIKSNICNKQWYMFGPVEKEFQDKIKKEYAQIMGQDLLPF